MPDDVLHPYTSLGQALSAVLGSGAAAARAERVSGGDINRAYCLTLTDDRRLFMKANSRENLPFFTAEAQGLAAIRAAGAISVPEVLALGQDPSYGSFLLMAWSRGDSRRPDFWEDFGRRLAALHRADTAALAPGGRFGFFTDNFIGATPQENTPAGSWRDFFRTQRLMPQLRRTGDYLDSRDRRCAERLLDRLDEFLPEPTAPALLHGDLWSGNYITGPDGAAWLIDPAAYVGHPEADLAMTELFGGFPEVFYAAYQEVSPLTPGYPARREIYNLYHLLNHLYLFGPSYLAPVRQTLRRFGG